MRGLALLGLIVVAAGCSFGGGKDQPFTGSVSFTLPRPPPESSWPPRPAFDPHSCWTRPVGGGAIAYAPSRAQQPSGLAPEGVAARILRRLGDQRFVTSVRLAPVAPVKLLRVKAYFGGRRPPEDARWGWIGTRGPSGSSAGMLPAWEAQLVGGALRDELCAAGGSPLVGWTVPGRNAGAFSDPYNVFGQRFPNPSPAAFRRALRAAGKAYGFETVEARLLRPLGLAPLVIVRTGRDRKEFVHDVAAIERLLNPRSGNAATFEGFYFEARDRDGPFIRTENVMRGTSEGGQWAWDPCALPYATLGLNSRCS